MGGKPAARDQQARKLERETLKVIRTCVEG